MAESREWGPRLPASPERAKRNQAAVRDLVRRHDPRLARVLGRVVREQDRERAVRSR